MVAIRSARSRAAIRRRQRKSVATDGLSPEWRSGAREILGVLLPVVGVPKRPAYFKDQVTGRFVERSGGVCMNLLRRVYSFPVTALSLAFQRNSLSRRAINSRTVRCG